MPFKVPLRSILVIVETDNKTTNTMNPMQIIRPAELAEILSVSKQTLWRMENRGDLPKRVKISKRAVAGWLPIFGNFWRANENLKQHKKSPGRYERQRQRKDAV